MGRYLIMVAIVAVVIVTIGTVATWNEIGMLRGSIVCPKPGQEFPGKNDVIEIPISVTSNGTWAGVRIERGGKIIWSEPIAPNGNTTAKILDPATLQELNEKGFVDLSLVFSVQKQAEQMRIMGTGIGKESGTIPKDSPPVLFRAVREGNLKVGAIPLGGKVSIKVVSKSRKIALYSKPQEQVFGLLHTFDKVEIVPNPGGMISFLVSWGPGQESEAITDGSETTAIVLLSPVVVINNARDRQPVPQTDEVSMVSFESEGTIGYPFDGWELVTTIAWWVAGGLVLTAAGALVHRVFPGRPPN